MNLTLFDLDNTLLADDSDHMWGQFLVDQRVVDADIYAHANDRFYAQYRDGTLDIFEYQRFVLRPLVDNPAARMNGLRQQFVRERVKPAVAPHAKALIEAHRAQGNTIVIITATNRFITAPIAELLGIDHLIATEPEIADGRYTGEIAGTPSFREGKIRRLAAWRETQPERFSHTYFYSDSHNDEPLLREADTAIAVDPDPQLTATAAAAGWPVISLRGVVAPNFSL